MVTIAENWVSDVGWQQLILVVVCCAVSCGCDKPVLATLLVEKVEIGPAKMAGFFAFITKKSVKVESLVKKGLKKAMKGKKHKLNRAYNSSSSDSDSK